MAVTKIWPVKDSLARVVDYPDADRPRGVVKAPLPFAGACDKMGPTSLGRPGHCDVLDKMAAGHFSPEGGDLHDPDDLYVSDPYLYGIDQRKMLEPPPRQVTVPHCL